MSSHSPSARQAVQGVSYTFDHIYGELTDDESTDPREEDDHLDDDSYGGSSESEDSTDESQGGRSERDTASEAEVEDEESEDDESEDAASSDDDPQWHPAQEVIAAPTSAKSKPKPKAPHGNSRAARALRPTKPLPLPGTGGGYGVDLPLKTRTGVLRLGDAKVGDVVFGRGGKEVKITKVGPKSKRKLKVITFRDYHSGRSGPSRRDIRILVHPDQLILFTTSHTGIYARRPNSRSELRTTVSWITRCVAGHSAGAFERELKQLEANEHESPLEKVRQHVPVTVYDAGPNSFSSNWELTSAVGTESRFSFLTPLPSSIASASSSSDGPDDDQQLHALEQRNPEIWTGLNKIEGMLNRTACSCNGIRYPAVDVDDEAQARVIRDLLLGPNRKVVDPYVVHRGDEMTISVAGFERSVDLHKNLPTGRLCVMRDPLKPTAPPGSSASLPVPPWALAAWFGDGPKRSETFTIFGSEDELGDILQEWVEQLNADRPPGASLVELKKSIDSSAGEYISSLDAYANVDVFRYSIASVHGTGYYWNAATAGMQELGVVNNKAGGVPIAYQDAPLEDLLDFIGGAIFTDGYWQAKGNCYVVVQQTEEHKQWLLDLAKMCRKAGLHTSFATREASPPNKRAKFTRTGWATHPNYRLTIQGDNLYLLIPHIRNPRKTWYLYGKYSLNKNAASLRILKSVSSTSRTFEVEGGFALHETGTILKDCTFSPEDPPTYDADIPSYTSVISAGADSPVQPDSGEDEASGDDSDGASSGASVMMEDDDDDEDTSDEEYPWQVVEEEQVEEDGREEEDSLMEDWASENYENRSAFPTFASDSEDAGGPGPRTAQSRAERALAELQMATDSN
ncbi:hypothetical protein JCM10207_002274 [Rhodosporidiobolus poonsookiae]